MFICLNRLCISLITMNSYYKTYVKTDLASIHYITFIELLVVCPKEALSLDFDKKTRPRCMTAPMLFTKREGILLQV
jgi:hypothetical protein